MIRNDPYDWTIRVHVDGRKVKYTSLHHDKSKATTMTAAHMNFMENGIAYEGQLKFADLVCPAATAGYIKAYCQRTTDRHEEVTLSGSQLQCLGTIRVDFCRGKVGKDPTSTSVRCLVIPDVGVASEKGKK